MSSKGCQCASFQLIGDSITCHDYQEIRIQESVPLVDVGSIPRSMRVILMDDLVDLVKAGEMLELCGIRRLEDPEGFVVFLLGISRMHKLP